MFYNYCLGEAPGQTGDAVTGGIDMAKKHPLFTLLTGAALAGGLAYLMKKNNEKAAEPAVDADDIPAAEPEEGAWRVKMDGEEMSSEEVKERIKEEATKAFGNFKEEAKAVSGEILAGLKKVLGEVKTYVEEAKKQSAGSCAEEAGENCECAEETSECCCEKPAEAAEGAKECCCAKAEEIKEAAQEAADEMKEVVEDVIEEVKEAIKD